MTYSYSAATAALGKNCHAPVEHLPVVMTVKQSQLQVNALRVWQGELDQCL